LGILRIEFAPIGEKGAVGEADREEDQEGRAEDHPEAQSFSRDCNDDIFECPGKSESDGESNGENQLEQPVDFSFFSYPFDRFADPEGADGFDDEPVGEDDSEGDLIPVKGDKEFSQ